MVYQCDLERADWVGEGQIVGMEDEVEKKGF